jgi:hypothetical protein
MCIYHYTSGLLVRGQRPDLPPEGLGDRDLGKRVKLFLGVPLRGGGWSVQLVVVVHSDVKCRLAHGVDDEADVGEIVQSTEK